MYEHPENSWETQHKESRVQTWCWYPKMIQACPPWAARYMMTPWVLHLLEGWGPRMNSADGSSRKTLEINEAHPNQKNRSYLFSLCWSRGSQPPSLARGKDSRQAEEWKRCLLQKRTASGGLEGEAAGLRELDTGELEVRNSPGLLLQTYLAFSS